MTKVFSNKNLFCKSFSKISSEKLFDLKLALKDYE